ncbi:uncharacterized protein CANTADRAFT_139566 [Suhomyces tanzawaensis NRRL Y-17324]|uniref:Uncharacterized protein n=1 Tax=Suhomyces tanzawaensis NRRL Y-17324 TaxID=984487 RepID=A0A1E4SS01_9ASCO|nr:uncharacterized protein CANTADRAFT_139566 [Suhomyces tanzawaensis NRRL Y-17324]ODV82284.1 hypothetical protein CANTADRAFT_139566 [Suhomyces tanzawaensis NRRL Y-17324]
MVAQTLRRALRYAGGRSIPFYVTIVFVANLLIYCRHSGIDVKDKVTIQDADSFQKSPRDPQLYRSELPPTINSNGEPTNEAFDPRLAPALAINSIAHHLRHLLPKTWDSQYKLPFSWSSWVELTAGTDFRYTEDAPWVLLDPETRAAKVVSSTDEALDLQTRTQMGASYLLHSAPVPYRLAVLGVGPKKHTLIVPLYDGEGSDLNQLAKDYKQRQPGEEHTEIQKEITLLNGLCSSLLVEDPKDQELIQDKLRAVAAEVQPLKKEDFKLDANTHYQEIKTRVATPENVLDRRLYSALRTSPSEKYFHEAVIHEDKRGYHYD